MIGHICEIINVKSTKLIFPRFHQLKAVRKLLEQLKIDGTGKNYLIQHSAGSGKSNTITWFPFCKTFIKASQMKRQCMILLL